MTPLELGSWSVGCFWSYCNLKFFHVYTHTRNTYVNFTNTYHTQMLQSLAHKYFTHILMQANFEETWLQLIGRTDFWIFGSLLNMYWLETPMVVELVRNLNVIQMRRSLLKNKLMSYIYSKILLISKFFNFLNIFIQIEPFF